VRVAKLLHFYIHSIQKLTKENQDVNRHAEKIGFLRVHESDYRHMGPKAFTGFGPAALRYRVNARVRIWTACDPFVEFEQG
jgi:hypothetical protein